jgi:hypothetical protein
VSVENHLPIWKATAQTQHCEHDDSRTISGRYGTVTGRFRGCSKKCLESFRGLGMTEFAEDLRHHCRNPRCLMKLTAPVVNRHKAFCTRGCHSSFYLKRCLVCESDKPAGSTARRIVCRRPKCESKYRQNRGRYSFAGADTISAANASRSAQSTGIKSADFDARPCIVAGRKVSACVYHCAAQPLDADTANRIHAANNWDRIRREIAWCRAARPPIPIDVTLQACSESCVPSVPVADDLSIPDFLKREPAVSESPDVAAE